MHSPPTIALLRQLLLLAVSTLLTLQVKLPHYLADSAPKVGVSFDEMVQLVLRIVKPVQMEPPKRETDGTTDVNGNYVPPLYPKIKSETGKHTHFTASCC